MAKVTPTLETDLGYKLFLMFATINIGGMAVFSLYVFSNSSPLVLQLILTMSWTEPDRLIPETKGRSLEEMDVIFGAVQEDKRRADIAKQERGTLTI